MTEQNGSWFNSARCPPFVSVVIPVFNDTLRLLSCLKALEAQSYSKDHYEVIVVDNGSRQRVKPHIQMVPRVLCTEELQPGAYAARNRGLELSKGEVIGFTDADCLPREDWIEKGVTRLCADRNVGLVGGRVEFVFNNPQKPSAAELFDSIRNLQQKNCIKHSQFGVTANLFTFRRVLEEVGPFDSSLKSAGDLEWGRRVAASGYSLVFGEDVVVRHPARTTLGNVFKKSRRDAGGAEQLMSNSISLLHPGYLKILAAYLCPPVRFAFRLLRDDRVKGAKKKFAVLAIHTVDKYVRAWARLQVHFGKNPSR